MIVQADPFKTSCSAHQAATAYCWIPVALISWGSIGTSNIYIYQDAGQKVKHVEEDIDTTHVCLYIESKYYFRLLFFDCYRTV